MSDIDTPPKIIEKRRKPLLSIIIPVAPNREERLRAILSRLTLNQAQFPDHTFEVIVCDGGAEDGTRKLCEYTANHLRLKYIYMPIKRFVNAAYPRNVMLRVCEGEVISMIDIDHWPSENIVYGMLNPFIDDAGFRFYDFETRQFVSIDEVARNNCWKLNDQYQAGAQRVLNRGWVTDSSNSALCSHRGGQTNAGAEKVNEHLLNDANLNWQIMDVYKQAKIPHNNHGTLWIWAALRTDVAALNGYDEIFCRQFAYSREDDDWRERIKAQITGVRDHRKGWGFYDGQSKNFCAIHLWHPAGWRGQDTNDLNKKYYPTVCEPVRSIVRNDNWPWGKMIKFSFSVIGGVTREPAEHEAWIKDNIPDAPAYTKDPQWEDMDDYMKHLEGYVKNG